MAALVPPRQRLVVDAFTFYNEYEMLEFRLTELDDVVDVFVICEATLTHAGAAKPLLFEQSLARYERWLPKIVHVVDDDMPRTDDAWVREHHQREALACGLGALGLADDDWVAITDCDEIADAGALAALQRRPPALCALVMRTFYYSFDWVWRDPWDVYPKVAPWSAVRDAGPQAIRMTFTLDKIDRGGWHLSYFGNEAFVKNKLEQFAHQEFNTERDLDAVGARMRGGKNLTDDQFDRVPADEPFMPQHRSLLEALLRRQGADPRGAEAPVDARLAATLRATVRTSRVRKAPRKKKIGWKRS